MILNYSRLTQSLAVLQQRNKYLETELTNLQTSVKTQREQCERDRTIFTKETQAHRAQEQKLINIIQQYEKDKDLTKDERTNMIEEQNAIKQTLKSAQEQMVKFSELENEITVRNEEIDRLRRKCARLERELSLKLDEENL